MVKNSSTPKKAKKKGPGRGWHGSSADHAAAGRKGGFVRAARWRAAHQASDTTDTKKNEA